MCELPTGERPVCELTREYQKECADQCVNYWRELSYRPVCELPERDVTDQCVNYWRESSYRPVCELPERVELQTSV